MFTFITNVIGAGGLWALFGLMILENVFPLLPSELILPMAGYASARGAFALAPAIVVAGAGSAIGAVPLYLAMRALDVARVRDWVARHGRWVTLTPREVDIANEQFGRWGFWAVLVGRTLPGVRGVICLPAGLARQPFGQFALALCIGSFCWSALVMSAGYLLRAQYQSVERWLNPVTDTIVALGVLLYVYRLVRGSKWFRRSA